MTEDPPEDDDLPQDLEDKLDISTSLLQTQVAISAIIRAMRASLGNDEAATRTVLAEAEHVLSEAVSKTVELTQRVTARVASALAASGDNE